MKIEDQVHAYFGGEKVTLKDLRAVHEKSLHLQDTAEVRITEKSIFITEKTEH